MALPHPLRTLLTVLSNEGWRAARDRLADVREAVRKNRRHPPHDLPASNGVGTLGTAPVLNLSPVPPFPRRGGAQLQMLDRLAVEARSRPVALLYPSQGRWQLELSSAAGRRRWWLPDAAQADVLGSAVAAVKRAATLCESRAVHLENPAGLPLELGPTLAACGHRLVLSLHDFVCFCRRPHLIDATSNEFCEFSTDDGHCRACLAAAAEPVECSQADYRRLGAAVLAAAECRIYPSAYLRETYRSLFPALSESGCEKVIAPATRRPELPSQVRPPVPHLALVGGAKAHKGGLLSAEMVRILRRRQPLLRITLYGDGDPRPLAELRRAGVHIRGYYRAGQLASLLDRDGVSAAVLPSIWPESYALVVDECLHAGVPVAAFALGAVAPRLRHNPMGRLAAPGSGAPGLAAAVVELLRSTPPAPQPAALRLPTPEDSAAATTALYQELGLC